jgi:hypothetical protein
MITTPRIDDASPDSALTSGAAEPGNESTAGTATGGVRLILQAEGLAVLVLATVLYHQGGHGWGLFAALFLAPDISFVAYLAGPRAGAIAYNALHSYIGPLALLLISLSISSAGVTALVYIWAAHIGFDRLLRYGLKYPGDFHHTHLGSKRRSA